MTRILQMMALTIAVFAAGPTRGADPVPAARTVDDLIADLGHKDYATRERASAALLARGAAALPAVRKAATGPDAERSRRAQDVLRVLEVRALLEPKRVTLKPGPWTFNDAAKEIHKQTGYEFKSDAPDAAVAVRDLALTNVTAWEAAARLSLAWDSGMFSAFTEEGVGFSPDCPPARFAAADGAFRVELTDIHEDRDINFKVRGPGRAAGAKNQVVTLTFRVAAEPRFFILNAGPALFDVASDGAGTPLVPRQADDEVIQEGEFQQNRFRASSDADLRAELRRGDGPKAAAGTLRGGIPIRVVAARKRVVVTDEIVGSKGTKFTINGKTLRIDRAEVDEHGQFDLTVSLPPARERETDHWDDRISVEDAAGVVLHAYSRGGNNVGDQRCITFGFRPSKNGEKPPARLVVEEWTVVPHTVRFDFAKVPFP